jgi:predicted ester cyclase
MEVNSIESNKAIMRSVVENNDAHTFYAYMDSVSEDFVGHNPFVPGGLHGNKSFSDFFYLTEKVAFPDGVHVIHQLFGEGDMVTLELSYSGTFTGPLPDGTQPNFKTIEFRYNILCRFAEGKLAEVWWYPYDSYSLMKDLGMI